MYGGRMDANVYGTKNNQPIIQYKNTLQAPVKSLRLRIACDQVHILMSNVPFRTVARLELGQCHLGCLNFDIVLTQSLKYGLHLSQADGFVWII